jgi:hypothetical protein
MHNFFEMSSSLLSWAKFFQSFSVTVHMPFLPYLLSSVLLTFL